MSNPIIEIEHMSAAYGRGERRTLALQDVNLCVQAGEIFGLLGPNGAGKSTLLACVEGLHNPERGTLRAGGHDVRREPGAATAMGMTLYFGLMFISDLIFPLDQLPAWLQKVVPYLPSTLVIEMVRPALLSATLDPQWLAHMGLLAVYAAAATLVVSRVFRWDPRA
jgi:ABC-type cobalamin/Fe3+-siderophores transport system ATPase subunit